MKFKNVLLTAISMFGLTMALFAQKGGYEKAMNMTFSDMSKAKTGVEQKQVANKFVRIGEAEKEEWLPFYYASLEYTKMALATPTAELIKLSEEYRQKAIERAGEENAELLVIKGMQLTAKLLSDPGKYGPTLTPDIIGAYKKALALVPNHPRAYLMLTQYEENMAKFMGNSEVDFCAKYKKAVANFSGVEVKELHPFWGEKMASNRVALCEKIEAK